MNRGRGLASLLRWRGFEQSLADARLQASIAESGAAQVRLTDAREALSHIEQLRLSMLDAGQFVDLTRMDAVMGIEDAAGASVRDCEGVAESARHALDASRQAFQLARSRTRVVEERSQRVEREAREREEKVDFDRMADLFALTHGRPE